MVKYPNLVGAMAAKGKKHYEIAIAVGMDESVFSRCVRGLRDFSYQQRRRIAVFLDCPEHWLFKKAWRPRSGWNKSKTGLGRKFYRHPVDIRK